MLAAVLAIAIPPHARVNTKCWPVWNADRSNLKVVWEGREYSQPWTFTTEVDGARETCKADECAQRLWCTDSGAVGRYRVDSSLENWNRNVRLEYTWLMNTSALGVRLLSAQGRENDSSTIMEWSSAHAPATVLVVGDTLFFYTYVLGSANSAYGLPRLSSLTFAEYRSNVGIESLAQTGLDAFSVLGSDFSRYWGPQHSPIYPAGEDALTISVEDYYNGAEN